jgi:hypothetical protein
LLHESNSLTSPAPRSLAPRLLAEVRAGWHRRRR